MHSANSATQFLATARFWGAGWWMTFLAIAVFTTGGLTDRTALIACAGVLSYLLGTAQMSFGRRPAHHLRLADAYRQPRPVLAMLYLWAVILLQCGLAARSLSSLSELGTHFRESYYEGEVLGGSILFVSYESFIVPLGIYAVAHWLCRRTNIGLWVVTSLCFFGLDALLKAGRFPLYFFFFFLVLARVLKVIKIRIWMYAAAATGLVVAATLLVLVRQGLDLDTGWEVLSDLLRVGVLNYHLVGFHLFQQISNSAQFIDAFGGGAYTFGFISYVTALIVRRAGFDLQYSQQDLNVALTKASDIPNLGTFNAFGTNLLPLYLDAGFLGVVAGFYFLGFLTRGGFHKRAGVEGIDVIGLFTMIFGLFQPLIMGAYFAVPIVAASIQKVVRPTAQ